MEDSHELVSSGWHDLFKTHQKTGKHKKKVSFIQWDPWYEENRQPSVADFTRMAEASEYYAKRRCVMIVWFPWQHAEKFSKAFIVGNTWRMDKSPKTLIRKQSRIGRYGSPDVMKNVTDQHMVFYHVADDVERTEYNFNTAAVNIIFGNPQKDSTVNRGFRWTSNIIADYDPPHAWNRLEGDDGKPLRPRAEKSVWYNRMLLTGHTRPCDTVYDGMAGTFSMTLACTIANRISIACDEDADVFGPVRSLSLACLFLSSVTSFLLFLCFFSSRSLFARVFFVS